MHILLNLLQLLFTTCLASNNFKGTETNRIPKHPVPCEKDWSPYGDFCYKLFGQTRESRRNWFEAEFHCYELEGSLASIHSDRENDYITKLLPKRKDRFSWIGLSDIKEEGHFSWQDASSLDYENWGKGEPSGMKYGNEDCVGMKAVFNDLASTGLWNDAKCEKKHSYICQKRRIPETTVPKPPLPLHAVLQDSTNRKPGNRNKAFITYEDINSLSKASENIANGTLVFLKDEQSLVIRVRKGWKYIQLSKLLPARLPETKESP